MPTSLTARDRRALALGGVIVAPILLWHFALGPAEAVLTTTRTDLAAERALFERESALLAGSAARERHAEALVEAMITYAPRLFPPDESPPEELIRRVAGESNVSMLEIARTPSPDSTRPIGGMIQPIVLSAVAESDLEGILTLLTALHAQERTVVVERIDLSSEQAPESRLPERIVARLELKAFTAESATGGGDAR